MDGSPRPSEGAEESTAREDETQEVSESPERSWAQQVSDAQAQEESEEVMEVGYVEAAEAVMATAPYRDPTIPELSSDGETDGGTVGQAGHYVSYAGITLRALQSAIELVATSEIRDDAQAQGAL